MAVTFVAPLTTRICGVDYTAGDPVDVSSWPPRLVQRALSRGWIVAAAGGGASHVGHFSRYAQNPFPTFVTGATHYFDFSDAPSGWPPMEIPTWLALSADGTIEFVEAGEYSVRFDLVFQDLVLPGGAAYDPFTHLALPALDYSQAPASVFSDADGMGVGAAVPMGAGTAGLSMVLPFTNTVAGTKIRLGGQLLGFASATAYGYIDIAFLEGVTGDLWPGN